MAFEALLRLGGNIIIPGTDRNSLRYKDLALDMGLWVTHHHAQPLGAEMFSRAWPDLEPSWTKHHEKFEALWEESIKQDAERKIIWTLGFRGQGDVAFWENDPTTDGDAARARLLNSIIARQVELVRKYVEKPVFAHNIYNESNLFYKKGLLDLPEGTVKLFSDNGYGAMVSRREWDNDPRIPSMPAGDDVKGANGMYYHLSFYDLQMANHIVMTPVPLDFIASELERAYQGGIREMVIVNVSNVKPHLVPITLLAAWWKTGSSDADTALEAFARDYMTADPETVRDLFREYSNVCIKYGPHVDNVGGDQAFTYPVRMLMTSWVRGDESCHEFDFMKTGSIQSQTDWYCNLLEGCRKGISTLRDKVLLTGDSFLCEQLGSQLGWLEGACEGAIHFCCAFRAKLEGKLMNAFLELGRSADAYTTAKKGLSEGLSGEWITFYDNEALSDTGNMITLIKAVMESVRILGEGPNFFNWHRELTYPDEDKNVVLVTNYERRHSAYEMYEIWKERHCEDSSR